MYVQKLKLLLVLDVFVNSCSGLLACTHCQNNGSCTGNYVAACKYVFQRSLALFVVSNDATLLAEFQTLSGLTNQGVGGGADCDNNNVSFDYFKFAFNSDGLSATLFVGFAQFHNLSLNAGYAGLHVAHDFQRTAQGLELDAFFLCVVNFFLTCGQFIETTTVNDGNFFSAQTQCATSSVHCYVAAANDRSLAGTSDGGHSVFLVCLHQVDTGQEFVCGVNTLQVFAGDLQELRQTCTGADEYCVVFVAQFFNVDNLTNNPVGLDFNAQLLQAFDFLCYDSLGQTEFGNTVNQNAAGSVQSFENGNSVATLCQVACAGQRCGTGANNSNLVAVGFGLYNFNCFLSVVVVSYETFDAADCNGFALDAAVAELFALVFLGADTAANCGQAGVQRNDAVSFIVVALFSSLDESGDVQINRAALTAVRNLAVQAASSFVLYLFFGVEILGSLSTCYLE